jgi:hypothetical protein
MRTALFLLALYVSPVRAQGDSAGWVGFPVGNGRALRISTQADGADGQTVAIRGTLLRTGRSTFHRVLLDSSSRVVFAYDLELPDTEAEERVRLLVKPVSAEYARTLAGPLPTFSSVRTVSLKAPGERASIELLVNPKTGQKIVDVLELAAAPDVAGGAVGGLSGDTRARELRFSHAELWSNGVRLTPESANAISGNVVMLYLPGIGGFFFTREEPKGYGFTRTGLVDGNRLKFIWANQTYECVSSAQILPDDTDRKIWVLHDPHYQPKNPAGFSPSDRFQFGAATSAKSILGDRN